MVMVVKNNVLPYLGMVVAQLAQAGLLIVSKKAMSTGMPNLIFIFYSNALASLILLPLSLLIHRSNRPSLSLPLLGGFVSLGVIGFLVQVAGYAGIQYSSASLASAMLNIIPGFTFILAIIFRMEAVDCGKPSTQAKAVGTFVSIAGAIVVTLYKGPSILPAPLNSIIRPHLLLQPSNWIIGGLFLVIDCIFSSAYIIVQALVLRDYPAELIVIFSYCFVVAVLSGLTSLVVERDLSSFSLQSKMRLYSILYSGVFGSAVQVTVMAWCVRMKGPLFVAMFHPIGIIFATALSVIFLNDGLYLGSLLGSIVIVVGFYSVMWGKAKEEGIVESNTARSLKLSSENAPLLQGDVEDEDVLLLS